MDMNQKNEFFMILIVSIFIFGFFLVGVSFTGKVTQEVYKGLNSDTTTNVIVILKDKPVSEFGVNDGNDSNNFEKRKIMVKKQQDKVLSELDNNYSDKSYYNKNKRNLKNIKNKKLKINKRFNLVNGFSAEVDLESLRKLNSNPDVLKIYTSPKYSINLDNSVPLINADDVFNLQFGNVSNITGLGETICVVDTGVNYTHPALINSYIGGHDYVNDDSNPLDDNGHGSHVSGIIASNDSLYRGVAPDSKIVAMKVMDSSGSGSADNIVLGIEDCVLNKSVYNTSIISISIGDTNHYDSYCDSIPSYSGLKTVIDLAVREGINVIVSSGNEASKNGISSPACLANATSVGWTDDNDNIHPYSNSGNILDLLAPGNFINSVNYISGFKEMSGTSMSAPHVSGAIALLRQFSKEYNHTNLSVNDAIFILNKTGVGLVDTNGLKRSRIDVYSAILSFDFVNPNLVVDSPINKTYLINNISLDYSANDDLSLDSVWFNLQGLNYSLNNTLYGNSSLNLSNGNYLLNIYTNDSAGNLNNSNINFTINLSLPMFVDLSPNNDYISSNGNFNFSCNVSSNLGLVNISFYHNLSGNFSLNSSLNVSGHSNSSYFNLGSIADNSKFGWYCRVYDNNTNSVLSGIRRTSVVINNAPNWTSNIGNISLINGTEYDLDLSSYVYDEEGGLSYSSGNTQNISVSFSGSVVSLTPDTDFSGVRNITFYVSDSEFNDSSNLVYLNVNLSEVIANNPNQSSNSSESVDSNSANNGGNGGGTTLETNNVVEDNIIDGVDDNVKESKTVPVTGSDNVVKKDVKKDVKEIAKPKINFISKVFNLVKKPFVFVKDLIIKFFIWLF